MEEKSNAFLETEPVGKLMAKYAVPCVISLLVAALYNVVDQIFIANATYLGSFGTAANTVVFPMTVVALAIAVLIGDGCCAFVSLSLGGGREEDAHKSIGSAIILCILCSVVLTAVYLIFMEPILTLFGGKVNGETYACAREYFFWISLGIPFYMFGQAMNPIIRSDGSPKFAMAATLASTMISLTREVIFGVSLPIILTRFFGLDGLLYSFPLADILTFVFALVVIIRTYRELSQPEPALK